MPKERLTDTRIAAFSPTQEAWLRDTETHLAVRGRPSGSKAFVFRSNLNYREVRITIGEVGAVALSDAKEKARLWQGWIEDGKDPREVLRQQEEAEAAAQAALVAAAEAAAREVEDRQRYTLRALCDAYCAALAAKGKAKSAAATRSAFKCHVAEAHPKIASTPAREVTSRQVALMVRGVREAGKERQAGALRSYLSAAYNCAKRAPFDSAMPADLIPFEIEHNPVDAIPAIPVKAGNRTLSVAELRGYLSALGDDLADQALLLAILAGGQRMEQLLRATVSDYDPQTETLRLWDGKGRRRDLREHLLPLAPRAAGLVATLVGRASDQASRLEHTNGKGSPLLFSTFGTVQLDARTPGKRAGEISASMGGVPFNLRDIRRTVETMLAGMGISRDTRAQLMSHGLSGVQATHYDRHTYTNEKRAALVAWEARLEEIQTGERANNVVELAPKVRRG